MAKFTKMLGTDGTGEYIVFAVGRYGCIGYRLLGDKVRIRVEPLDEVCNGWCAQILKGWTQPTAGNMRYSLVADRGPEVLMVVRLGFGAISGLSSGDPEINPDAADWRKIISGKSAPKAQPKPAAPKKLPIFGKDQLLAAAKQLAQDLRELRGNS